MCVCVCVGGKELNHLFLPVPTWTSVQALGAPTVCPAAAGPTNILKANKIMAVGTAEAFTYSSVVCAVISRCPVGPAVPGHSGKPEASGFYHPPYITPFLFIRLTASTFLQNIRAVGDTGDHLVPGLIGELSLGPFIVPLNSFPHSLASGGLLTPIYSSVFHHPSEASPRLNEI